MLEQIILSALGEGEHVLPIASPGPPSLVIVREFGCDDQGDPIIEIEVHDSLSEDSITLEMVVGYIEWQSLLQSHGWSDPYRIFPAYTPKGHLALKTSIAEDGQHVAVIRDQDGNLLDGFERHECCRELALPCITEVRCFSSETQKYQLILDANSQRRRHLNKKQKEKLIEAYLLADPEMADHCLADTIGVSKNTVARIRRTLEDTSDIPKLAMLRGKDGKKRPAKYNRVIANTPRQLEIAKEAIQSLPPSCAGRVIDTITAERRARRQARQEDRNNQIVEPLADDDIRLYHCRFQELEGIEPKSVNLMLTDIPYEELFLPQVDKLAQFAQRVLVEGGLFVMYYGMAYLNRVIATMDKYLTYRWTMASVWGGDGNIFHPIQVLSQWKPILVYSNGPWHRRERWPDVLRVNSKEKDCHEWQQPLEEAERLVSYFSRPGELVLDPCGGGFTTAEACFHLSRKCVSCDDVAENYQKGLRRLQQAKADKCDRS
jgi:hypothetical protein